MYICTSNFCGSSLLKSLFYYALLCVHSNYPEEEEKVGCFAIIVLPMYSSFKCSVTLSHGVVGWSAVCNCCFS